MKSVCVLVFMLVAGCVYSQPGDTLRYIDTPFSEILYIERDQFKEDHHNTETMFQLGEVSEHNFVGGSAMKAYDLKTKRSRVLLSSEQGIIRDPELSFDGKRIIFSMRRDKTDFYHIYEIGIDGSNLKQLTFARGVSDIDPLYLPDGTIIFSSTREPKYCMCNRNIMCNLYRMDADGANITQIGKSTLFEANSALLDDGRVIYDRWEYVDRNFGDAQGLWTVNPDGTKHSVYYGNNTGSPGAVLDGRQIPGTDLVTCLFCACHDRPWGALAVIDRKQGVDSIAPLVQIWPPEARYKHVGVGHFDEFKNMTLRYEDPFPINKNQILVSKSIGVDKRINDLKMALYLVDRRNGKEEEILVEGKSIFDAMPVAARFRPPVIPDNRDYKDAPGLYYVQNVYIGTHMEGVVPGSVKYLRVVESPPKRTWISEMWVGNGAQYPGMNYKSLENKVLLGEVPVEEDGSAYFEVPAGKFVYFQLLDKDKKMIQSMRSGATALQGEVNGCIGCHEDRINVPPPSGNVPMAMRKPPHKLEGWKGNSPEPFSYIKFVQPVFDKHCVSCHDFDNQNRDKLVLASDRNSFFNASYIELWHKKKIDLVGGGGALIKPAYSWGSHASILTKVIDSDHNGIKLSDDEKNVLYTWMDMNGVYYPTYESAYPENLAGRCPLQKDEMTRLIELTGVDIRALNIYRRSVSVQISFDRPELSPCLDNIRNDKAKYNEAVAILRKGGERLKERSNGEVIEGFVPCEEHQKMLKNYVEKLEVEERFRKARTQGIKIYDERN